MFFGSRRLGDFLSRPGGRGVHHCTFAEPGSEQGAQEGEDCLIECAQKNVVKGLLFPRERKKICTTATG